jgi:hypothetical protein
MVVINLNNFLQSMEKKKLSICFAKFHSELFQEIKNKSWNVAITPKHLFECLITYAKYVTLSGTNVSLTIKLVYFSTLKKHQDDLGKQLDLIVGTFNTMSASSKKLADLSANLLQAQRKGMILPRNFYLKGNFIT